MFSTEGRARRMAGLRELVTASAAADRALSPRSKNSSSSASSASAQASAASAESASVIGLHGGFPPASSFPFVKLTATLRDGSVIEVEDPAEVRERERGSFFFYFLSPFRSRRCRRPSTFFLSLSFSLSSLSSLATLSRSSPPSSTRSSSGATVPCTPGRRGTSWSSTLRRGASSGSRRRARRRRTKRRRSEAPAAPQRPRSLPSPCRSSPPFRPPTTS